MIRKLKSGEYRLYSRKVDSTHRPQAQPRHVQQPGRGGEARARGSVLQAALATCQERRPERGIGTGDKMEASFHSDPPPGCCLLART